jgi:hypothetical protein
VEEVAAVLLAEEGNFAAAGVALTEGDFEDDLDRLDLVAYGNGK